MTPWVAARSRSRITRSPRQFEDCARSAAQPEAMLRLTNASSGRSLASLRLNLKSLGRRLRNFRNRDRNSVELGCLLDLKGLLSGDVQSHIITFPAGQSASATIFGSLIARPLPHLKTFMVRLHGYPTREKYIQRPSLRQSANRGRIDRDRKKARNSWRTLRLLDAGAISRNDPVPHDPHRAPLHRRAGPGAALRACGRALPREPADSFYSGQEARGRTGRAVRARQAEDPADAAGPEDRSHGRPRCWSRRRPSRIWPRRTRTSSRARSRWAHCRPLVPTCCRSFIPLLQETSNKLSLYVEEGQHLRPRRQTAQRRSRRHAGDGAVRRGGRGGAAAVRRALRAAACRRIIG